MNRLVLANVLLFVYNLSLFLRFPSTILWIGLFQLSATLICAMIAIFCWEDK